MSTVDEFTCSICGKSFCTHLGFKDTNFIKISEKVEDWEKEHKDLIAKYKKMGMFNKSRGSIFMYYRIEVEGIGVFQHSYSKYSDQVIEIIDYFNEYLIVPPLAIFTGTYRKTKSWFTEEGYKRFYYQIYDLIMHLQDCKLDVKLVTCEHIEYIRYKDNDQVLEYTGNSDTIKAKIKEKELVGV